MTLALISLGILLILVGTYLIFLSYSIRKKSKLSPEEIAKMKELEEEYKELQKGFKNE
jgi:hypothetical protein